jgi:hypothetical protein
MKGSPFGAGLPASSNRSTHHAGWEGWEGWAEEGAETRKINFGDQMGVQ